jgi:hypothetical protein
MGLPEDWLVVEGWTNAELPFFSNAASENGDSVNETVLGKTMPDEFWEEFPQRELPQHPTTAVNIKKLQALGNKYCKKWTLDKKMKAAVAVESLKRGAPANKKSVLPAIQKHNAPSAYQHADKFTEALRDWVAGGVVAGPFRSVPLPCPTSAPTA